MSPSCVTLILKTRSKSIGRAIVPPTSTTPQQGSDHYFVLQRRVSCWYECVPVYVRRGRLRNSLRENSRRSLRTLTHTYIHTYIHTYTRKPPHYALANLRWRTPSCRNCSCVGTPWVPPSLRTGALPRNALSYRDYCSSCASRTCSKAASAQPASLKRIVDQQSGMVSSEKRWTHASRSDIQDRCSVLNHT